MHKCLIYLLPDIYCKSCMGILKNYSTTWVNFYDLTNCNGLWGLYALTKVYAVCSYLTPLSAAVSIECLHLYKLTFSHETCHLQGYNLCCMQQLFCYMLRPLILPCFVEMFASHFFFIRYNDC